MKIAIIGVLFIFIGVFLATGLSEGITGYGISFLGYNFSDTQLSGWTLSALGAIINITRFMKDVLKRFS